METTKYPPTQFIPGNGKKSDRFILVINVDDKFKELLKTHHRAGSISINVVEKKAIGKFGDTHFMAINQNSSWPVYKKQGNDFLTFAERPRPNIISFTLPSDIIKSLVSTFTLDGHDRKRIMLELIDNGRVGVFRYHRDQCDEAKAFIKPMPVNYLPVDQSFFNDL